MSEEPRDNFIRHIEDQEISREMNERNFISNYFYSLRTEIEANIKHGTVNSAAAMDHIQKVLDTLEAEERENDRVLSQLMRDHGHVRN